MDTFVEQGDCGHRGDENCYWGLQFLYQPRLVGGKGTEQFDELDKHPIIGQYSQETKQAGGQGEIILWIASGKLADDIDHSGNDTWIWIINPFLQPDDTLRECFWILLTHSVKGQDGPLADVGMGVVEHDEDFRPYLEQGQEL